MVPKAFNLVQFDLFNIYNSIELELLQMESEKYEVDDYVSNFIFRKTKESMSNIPNILKKMFLCHFSLLHALYIY